MDGVRGGDRHPGRFRDYQNWIGRDPDVPIEDARYVPPPVIEMGKALDELREVPA